MKILDLFMRFLEIEGCKTSFKANFEKDEAYYTFDEMVDSVKPTMFISVAFSWINTPEGTCFWDDVDTDWGKYYEKHKHKIGIDAIEAKPNILFEI